MSSRLLVAIALLAVMVVCCSCGKPADTTTEADVPANAEAALDTDETAVAEAARARAFFLQFYEPPPPLEIEAKVPQYALPLEPGQIVNWEEASRHFKCTRTAELILQNGFAVEEGWGGALGAIVTAYENLPENVPTFVTVDTVLHIQHVLHDQIFSEIEQTHMRADLQAITIAGRKWFDKTYAALQRTPGAATKELAAARLNMAYFAVAARLLDPDAVVPRPVLKEVTGTLLNMKSGGMAQDEILRYGMDYGQFEPRGHYTRSEELARYFRAMTWYAQVVFLFQGGPKMIVDAGTADIQTIQALQIARFLVENPDTYRRWKRMRRVLEFFAGTVDDISPADVIRVKKTLDSELSAAGIAGESVGESAYLRMLRERLRALPAPRIHAAAGLPVRVSPVTPERKKAWLEQARGMRLFGQRFSLDGYAMSELTGFTYMGEGQPFTRADTPMGPVRGYPTPLDVMAVLGSDEAEAILRAAGDADYAHYDERLRQLKGTLAALPDSQWHGSLAACRLDIVRALLDAGQKGYPTPMQTAAWRARRLNTALGTWTQSKRDLVLVQKKPVLPVLAGQSPRPCLDYVEPALAVYQRMLATDQAIRDGLAALLTDQGKARNLCQRLVMFDGWVSGLEQLARKELNGIRLDDNDGGFLKRSTTLTVREMLSLLERDLYHPAVVGDVFTEPNEERVLEVATGRFNLLWFVYRLPSGEKVLGAGPVMSYYEFKQPMAARLTDEDWRRMLDEGRAPDPPAWTKTFLAPEPKD
jgi:hypothetical protein